MSSLFTFMRGRETADVILLPESTPAGLLVANTNAHSLNADLEAAPDLPNNIVSSPEQGLERMLATLRAFLEQQEEPLSTATVSSARVAELSLGIGNRRGTEYRGAFPAVALKGGRLDADVRFQIQLTNQEEVDPVIDNLHTALLAARDRLRRVGFLRIKSEGSSIAEHIPSLDTWQKTADYNLLYEFHYADSEGAASLIARIPIEAITDQAQEVTVVTDDMVRWDGDGAPALVVQGPFNIRQLSFLVFVPETPPAGEITLLRTFDSATGDPAEFGTLGEFVSAITDPANPERHAQITFASLVAFLGMLTEAGDPIMLGNLSLEIPILPVPYQAYVLDFTPRLILSRVSERLELSFEGSDFDEAVLYVQAKRG